MQDPFLQKQEDTHTCAVFTQKVFSVASKKCITIEMFGDLLAPTMLEFLYQGENVCATSSEQIRKLDDPPSSSHLRMKQN